jgi:two-component system, cell cycle sensor histidine kinase and response regulator CckA
MDVDAWKLELQRHAAEIVARQPPAIRHDANGGDESQRSDSARLREIEMALEDELVRDLQRRELQLELRAQQMNERQRELERLCRELEDRCRDLFAGSPLAKLELSLDGAIVEANPAAGRLFGVTPAALTGRWLEQFVAEADRERFIRHRARACDLEVDGCVLSMRGAEGERIVQLESVCRPARVRRWRATLIDLTGQRRLEEALSAAQRHEAAMLLASAYAHDINNLLMGMSGCVELVLATTDPESPSQKPLRRVQEAIRSGADLVRELSRFKRRAESDEVVDLRATIKRSRTMLERLMGENCHVRLGLSRDRANIRCAAVEIEQVLLNLAINARAAMPRGGTLTITTSLEERTSEDGEPKGYVALCVADTGHGMDADTRASAFEPFFTTRSPGEGSGLGLSTVRGIAVHAGGLVELESQPGRGTTVRVLFPHVDAPVSLRPGPPSPPVDEPSLTIALVEDAELAESAIQQFLAGAGHQVLAARSLREALALCGQHPGPVDVCVIDVILPDGSGEEAARRIATVAPEAGVVFVSGHGAAELERRHLLPRGATLLAKPISEGALRHAVAEAARRGTARSSGDGPVILLVEDDASQRGLLETLLRVEGFDVVAAGGATEAIEALRDRDVIHLALVEQRLPDESGDALVRQIRRDRPELPVVFMSASLGPTAGVTSELARPHTAFVEKPFSFESLVQLVQAMIAASGAEAARALHGM